MKDLKKALLPFLAVSISLALFGCGSMIDSGDEDKRLASVAADTAASVGITSCFECHSDASNPAKFVTVAGDSAESKAAGEGWLTGPHGNYESSGHIDLGPDNTGFPYYSKFSDDTCKTCHDPKGDGELIKAFYDETGIDAIGRVDRPVIGCESCHGSGGAHFGTGPIQYASPDAARCGLCHNDTFPDAHLKHHPEGDRIYENYSTSPHALTKNSHILVQGSETDARALCSKCHTDEGAKLYKDVSGGYDALRAALPDSITHPFAELSAVQCRTCHDPHNPDNLLKPATSEASAEYNTCTNCHQTSDALHGENSSRRWDSGTVGVGNFDSSEIIYDTHFDKPLTPGRNSKGAAVANTGGIEGYILDPKNESVCADCHNPHKVDNTINEEWAHSAHAGHILETIDPVTGIANVTEEEGPAWVHYDFKARGSCRRCHTSTGFKAFADETDYQFTAITNQAELLYCWACHEDNVGGLRDPGAIISEYNASGAQYTFPDRSGSNVCIACHAGRVSGDLIKTSSADFTNTSFQNPHYLAAGGVLFNAIGYEYNGKDYENISYYRHNAIGTGEVSGTGGANGPCAGCHMKSSEGHLFEAVEKDVSGNIANIASYENTCYVCHGSSNKSTLISDMNDFRAGFENALDALKTVLAVNGLYFYPAHPYFYNTPYDPYYTESGACQQQSIRNWQTGGNEVFFHNGTSCIYNAADSNPGTSDTGKDNMGAAFNYQLLEHEPGSYVHNLLYTKRLIYDSIDHMDNGVLDNSVAATLSGMGATEASEFLYGVR